MFRFLFYVLLLWVLMYILSHFFDKINPKIHEFDGASETNLLFAFFISLFIVVSIRVYPKYKNSKK
jgi:fucose 4-O-acetylase-like acetyltransferase